MGATTETPKGNIFNENEFNQVNLFPESMESTHKLWLGFKLPARESPPPVEKPYWTLTNGDIAPYPGLEYILQPYKDPNYTIPMTFAEVASRGIVYVLRHFDFEAEDIMSGGFKIGIRVTSVEPCKYQRSLLFMQQVPEEKVKMLYHELPDVTTHINNALDQLVMDTGAFESTKETFRSLMDIRRLEAIRVV